jgi:hypothetical protein
MTDSNRRRRRCRAPALAGALLLGLSALATLGPGAGIADHEPRACAGKQPKKLCLTVTDTPDPVAYSGFDDNSTWLSYEARVKNAGRSKLSKVRMKQALPAGATLSSVSSSAGKCTERPRRVVCSVGSLKKRKSLIVDLVVGVPASSEPDPPETTLTSAATASFRARGSKKAGARARRASATYVETTTLSKTAGQTYVPAGDSGKVGTDPEQAQYANSSIPNASTDVLAAIEVAPPDEFCPNGKVKLHHRLYICREGGFVEASVTEALTGAVYTNPLSPLVFHLRWDGSLVSEKQTVHNFVVFYQASEGAPIEVFDERCDEEAVELPCLTNITELPDGGFSVDLVKEDNGRMR